MSAHDSTTLRDEMSIAMSYNRPDTDCSTIRGYGLIEVHGPDGELKASVPFTNLITQIGEQLYGERGAGLTTLATPTGMQLGTGTTAVAKTGGGAAIATYVTGSAIAVGTPTSGLSGANTRQITYTATWGAGVATATGIAEVVIINQSVATNSAASSANTISRALLSPTVNKGSSDSLTVTWNHSIGT